MRVATVYQLQDRIDRSLAGRKRELTLHRFAIHSSDLLTASALRRAGVMLLYAHWEGFVKEAAALYLRMIAGQSHALSKLQPNVVAMALRSTLVGLSGSGTAAWQTQIVMQVLNALSDATYKAKFSWRGAIRTRANLGALVFREFVRMLGLDYSQFEAREKPVISGLALLRNTVAHGRQIPVEFSTYDRLHAGVISLLDDWRSVIVDAAAAGRFLR